MGQVWDSWCTDSLVSLEDVSVETEISKPDEATLKTVICWLSVIDASTHAHHERTAHHNQRAGDVPLVATVRVAEVEFVQLSVH